MLNSCVINCMHLSRQNLLRDKHCPNNHTTRSFSDFPFKQFGILRYLSTWSESIKINIHTRTFYTFLRSSYRANSYFIKEANFFAKYATQVINGVQTFSVVTIVVLAPIQTSHEIGEQLDPVRSNDELLLPDHVVKAVKG